MALLLSMSRAATSQMGTFQTSSYIVGEHAFFLNIDINKPVNLVVKGEEVQREIAEDLTIFFRSEKKISVAYLSGSHAKKTHTPKSDVDIAVLLSETPKKLRALCMRLYDNPHISWQRRALEP